MLSCIWACVSRLKRVGTIFREKGDRHIILQGHIKALKFIQWIVCKKGGFSFDKAIREGNIRRRMFLVHGKTIR
jgi:hypothetical protein